MKIKIKYKDILYETIGETSMDNTWQFIGVSLSDLLIFNYDNPYCGEISKINKDGLKRHKNLEDAQEKWINENSFKLSKTSFVYDGDVNIEINKQYFPFPIYMPTSDDFEIPHCSSSEFDISKMKIYIKHSLIKREFDII